MNLSNSVGGILKISVQCCFGARITGTLPCLGIVIHRFVLPLQEYGIALESWPYLFFRNLGARLFLIMCFCSM